MHIYLSLHQRYGTIAHSRHDGASVSHSSCQTGIIRPGKNNRHRRGNLKNAGQQLLVPYQLGKAVEMLYYRHYFMYLSPLLQFLIRNCSSTYCHDLLHCDIISSALKVLKHFFGASTCILRPRYFSCLVLAMTTMRTTMFPSHQRIPEN